MGNGNLVKGFKTGNVAWLDLGFPKSLNSMQKMGGRAECKENFLLSPGTTPSANTSVIPVDLGIFIP